MMSNKIRFNTLFAQDFFSHTVLDIIVYDKIQFRIAKAVIRELCPFFLIHSLIPKLKQHPYLISVLSLLGLPATDNLNLAGCCMNLTIFYKIFNIFPAEPNTLPAQPNSKRHFPHPAI